MIANMIKNLRSKMEAQINRIEAWSEKIQEMFNKDLEEIKNRQSAMHNRIIEILKYTWGNNSRIAEAEEQISELEDRMVEITEAE